MTHHCLSDFLETLLAVGQLQTVTAEVDPRGEAAAITDRVAQWGGPALLFQRVRDHESAVLTNLFGTPRRVALALGIDSLDALAERCGQLEAMLGGGTWLDRLRGKSDLPALKRLAPKRVKVAACQQVVKLAGDVELAELPCLLSWPGEQHTAISGCLLWEKPGSAGQTSLLRATLPILDRNRLALPLETLSPLGASIQAAGKRKERLPVSLVLGGPPVFALMDDLLLGLQGDPFSFAGVLTEQPIKIVGCRTQQLSVPAEAEMVIEGVIDPAAEPARANTFATESGFYCPGGRFATIEITAITERANAVLPASVPAGSSGEAKALLQLREQMLRPLVQQCWPSVAQVALPWSGRGRIVVAGIEASDESDPARIGAGLLSLPQLMLAKTAVLVDAGTEMNCGEELLFRVQALVDPARDLHFSTGPVSQHDHAGLPQLGQNKLIIDATTKTATATRQPTPPRLEWNAQMEDLINRRWAEYGLEGG